MPLPTAPLADEALDIECHAFNAAFYELGLPWYWDGMAWAALGEGDIAHKLRRWLQAEQPHLLRAYDADSLVALVLQTQQRCLEGLRRTPAANLPRFNWADARWGQVGI